MRRIPISILFLLLFAWGCFGFGVEDFYGVWTLQNSSSGFSQELGIIPGSDRTFLLVLSTVGGDSSPSTGQSTALFIPPKTLVSFSYGWLSDGGGGAGVNFYRLRSADVMELYAIVSSHVFFGTEYYIQRLVDPPGMYEKR